MVELGDEVRDVITGFTGVVTGITRWQHGCTRCVVSPRTLKDGVPAPTHVFDEPQLDVISRGALSWEPVRKMPEGHPLPFGSIVKHRITGYTGVVIAHSAWFPDELSYTVQSQTLHNNAPIKPVDIVESTLEVLVRAPDNIPKPRGGDREDSARPSSATL